MTNVANGLTEQDVVYHDDINTGCCGQEYEQPAYGDDFENPDTVMDVGGFGESHSISPEPDVGIAQRWQFTITFVNSHPFIETVPRQIETSTPIAVGNLPRATPFRGFLGWATSPIGAVLPSQLIIDTNITLFPRWRVQPLTNAQLRAAFGTGSRTVPLTDLTTGNRFNISWHSPDPGSHTDWSPTASTQTAIIKRTINSSIPASDGRWDNPGNWPYFLGRAGTITLGGVEIAVGFHLYPHHDVVGGANPGRPLSSQGNRFITLQDAERWRLSERPWVGRWYLGGHMCMYYGDSGGGTLALNSSARDAFVRGN